MNKLISQVLKSAGVNGKVSKDSKTPKFRVYEGRLALEGVIRNGKYIMKITDMAGNDIDELSVSVKDQNSVINRISESIDTLKMLSKVYTDKKLIEEDDEFDTVSADEEEVKDESAPGTLEDGLAQLYAQIIQVAESVQGLKDLVSYDDAETLSTLISFESGLYDTAIDVDDFLSDLVPEEEEVAESVRTKRSTRQKVLDNMTVCEALIKRDRSLSDICTAIKDIKAELLVRGV